jgi:hypothetical protein
VIEATSSANGPRNGMRNGATCAVTRSMTRIPMWKWVARPCAALAVVVLLGGSDCRVSAPSAFNLTVSGRLMCDGVPVPHLTVVPNDGPLGQSAADGTFTIVGSFPRIPTSVEVRYDAQVPLSTATPPPTARLQIFDDIGNTRGERVTQETSGTSTAVRTFGDIAIPSNDCWLWTQGTVALTRHFAVTGAVPPAGQLRIKRWSAVFLSAGAAAHSFYDYVVAPTDLANAGTVFHEFGHTVRHVADGPHTHWDWDNTRFLYARDHDGGQITNKGFVFNEGWADYWGAVIGGTTLPAAVGEPAGAGFMDFNERRVATRLMELSVPVGHPFMLAVLTSNPGVIHTLQQFEDLYCARLGAGSNAFCAGGQPTRVAPDCPPGWNDDSATCRLVNIIEKQWYYRGPGTPLPCGPGRDEWLALCYPQCPAPFRAAGTNCAQPCPPFFADHSATCYREPNIFSDDPVVPP